MSPDRSEVASLSRSIPSCEQQWSFRTVFAESSTCAIDIVAVAAELILICSCCSCWTLRCDLKIAKGGQVANQHIGAIYVMFFMHTCTPPLIKDQEDSERSIWKNTVVLAEATRDASAPSRDRVISFERKQTCPSFFGAPPREKTTSSVELLSSRGMTIGVFSDARCMRASSSICHLDYLVSLAQWDCQVRSRKFTVSYTQHSRRGQRDTPLWLQTTISSALFPAENGVPCTSSQESQP